MPVSSNNCGVPPTFTDLSNVTVMSNVSPSLYGPPVADTPVTTGAASVTVTEYAVDCWFELPAVSVATSLGMNTVTVPSGVATTSKVYVVPDPAKFDASGAPPDAVPDTAMSVMTKSVTASLKTAVYDMVSELCVRPLGVEAVMATMGARSNICTL